ncbi:MAG: NosD domain-containing protein, partial [Candidatus Micrarchaeaceae archaeon]
GSLNNTISNSNITGSNVALYINNSTRNFILNNTAYSNNIGMLIGGNSRNNTIDNNTMEQSASLDYECSGNSGAKDENAAINYGSKKGNCKWLAALPLSSPDVSCMGINSPTSISMTSDGMYPYGYRCFGIYANGTTINCNGHTVISTSGGTFASFYNSTNGKVENCVLKGFSTPITARNSSIDVVNDTIVDNSGTGAAINITDSYYPEVMDSNISAYIGVSVANSKNGKIESNVAGSGAIAYLLKNSTGFTVEGNLALLSSAVGFVLNGSIFNTFENNNFQSIGGIACYGGAESAPNNTDLGGNICALNQNCKWVSSAQCR